MKKIIITMIAIAFSLSAFSAGSIYKLDEHKKAGKTLITVWCIHDKVFIETNEGGITQVSRDDVGGTSFTTCRDYERKRK